MRGGGSSWDMSSTCVQGGIPRPLGGYQTMMEPHSPAPAWHLLHPLMPKTEPMEEDRNDSGINSGSDFHSSSSPGSENSQDFNGVAYSSPQNPPTQNPFYSTPLNSNRQTSGQMTYTNLPPHLGFNPLTPPNSEPMPSQTKSEFEKEQDTTLTPCASPNGNGEQTKTEEDPLRRLQMAMEKNGIFQTSAASPKPSENSMDDDNKSEEGDEYDERGLKIPRMNSHGKMKTFKCKQCDFVAITKMGFWDHSKAHIKADKLLTCPKCPFVTEYKHHLEYHLRNHFGSKPFKCDKCSYSCVNKSMLNSHMKSHSNIYQYRCADCSYATKYCHSLKLHLRKYSHKPAMVLNPDGTPNPLPIIDVYGTRRGPKLKSSGNKHEDQPENPAPPIMQHPFAQFMMGASPQMQLPFPYPFLGGFPGAMANPLLFSQAFKQLQREQQEKVQQERESPSPVAEEKADSEVLDLSKPVGDVQQVKNRRKGIAFKLESRAQEEEDEEEEEEEDEDTKDEPKENAVENVENVTNNNVPGNFTCQYCSITFGDAVLYTIHMGHHGYKNPFTCNMCGEECNDKVSFYLHIARSSHS